MQDTPISRARYVQEYRKMRFQEAYDGWNEGRLTQAEAAVLLGQCKRVPGRLFALRCFADTLNGFLVAHFVTSLVVVALLIGVVFLAL